MMGFQFVVIFIDVMGFQFVVIFIDSFMDDVAYVRDVKVSI